MVCIRHKEDKSHGTFFYAFLWLLQVERCEDMATAIGDDWISLKLNLFACPPGIDAMPVLARKLSWREIDATSYLRKIFRNWAR